MKIQDLVFICAYLFLLALRKPKLFVYSGLASLCIAIPLFVTWTFFTAQRLTWYAMAFFAGAVIYNGFVLRRST